MVMYAKIRRMFFREHLSISEIARRTTLTRNTISQRHASTFGACAAIAQFGCLALH